MFSQTLSFSDAAELMNKIREAKRERERGKELKSNFENQQMHSREEKEESEANGEAGGKNSFGLTKLVSPLSIFFFFILLSLFYLY